MSDDNDLTALLKELGSRDIHFTEVALCKRARAAIVQLQAGLKLWEIEVSRKNDALEQLRAELVEARDDLSKSAIVVTDYNRRAIAAEARAKAAEAERDMALASMARETLKAQAAEARTEAAETEAAAIFNRGIAVQKDRDEWKARAEAAEAALKEEQSFFRVIQS